MVGLDVIRQAYGNGDISDIGWIHSQDTPADSLTKKGECPTIDRLIDEGRIDVEVIHWVMKVDGTKTRREQHHDFCRQKP